MRFPLMTVLFLTLCACASVPADSEQRAAYEKNNDPLEPMNRAVYAFNLKADDYLLRPVINGYRFVVPLSLRQSISNAFDNLNSPISASNQILQGRFKQAAVTVARLVVNTIAGFVGFYDVAARMGLEKEKTGFADTLGVWGVPSGPYLMLPLLGPSDMRDTTGLAGDFFLNPMTYATRNNGNRDFERFVWSETGINALVSYDNAVDLLDDLRKNSLDSYASMRSMYQMYRQEKIARLSGKQPTEDEKPSYEFSLDDFDEL